MSFFDKAKAQLTQAMDKHGDKVHQGIDKAADLADKRTGGKHRDKIGTAVSKAKEGLQKLDTKGQGDGGTPGDPFDPGTPGSPGSPGTPGNPLR